MMEQLQWIDLQSIWITVGNFGLKTGHHKHSTVEFQRSDCQLADKLHQRLDLFRFVFWEESSGLDIVSHYWPYVVFTLVILSTLNDKQLLLSSHGLEFECVDYHHGGRNNSGAVYRKQFLHARHIHSCCYLPIPQTTNLLHNDDL